jgi:cysteinyl-tRNA synthetase
MLRTLNKFVDEHQLEANPEKKEAKVKSLIKGTALLKEMGNVLGLFRQPSEKPGAGGQGDDEMTGKLLDLLVDIRSNARKNKDFATSDRIRDELAAIGVALEDRPDGTEWTLA